MMSQFDAVTLIRKKREAQELSAEEIGWLIDQYTHGDLPDYQMSAFLMAGFLHRLSEAETSALTHAMLHSGVVVNLDAIPGRKVDKHSTGGVGDKTSLLLAPIAAACGVPVPMISGRGLGHTGGTLDKLESIPGFTVNVTLDRYQEILANHGAVLIGQTKEIAPADKKIYALRDVTATVESIPFVASSIMSKKLAEGIDALVLDVKVGSGAFLKPVDQALELAQTLVGIGERFGKKTIAYLTDMNQPLGHAVGNWLEVEEIMDCLRGEGPVDLLEVSHLLAGTMIWLGEKASSLEQGIEMSKESISTGKALEKWLELVEAHGGDSSVLRTAASNAGTSKTATDSPHHAAYQVELLATREGFISSMDTFELGMISVLLGAGRQKKEDPVDPAAGFILHKKIGDPVQAKEPLLTFYTNRESMIESAKSRFTKAIQIASEPTESPKLVTFVVDADGVRPF